MPVPLETNQSSFRPSRWAHWPTRTDSPYFALFYGALSAYGVSTVSTLKRTEQWLQERHADVIHFHWPESFWRRDDDTISRRLRRVWDVRTFLSSAKRKGLKIVWTVHNLEAHEGIDWIDAMAYRILARRSDLIICHTRWSAGLVAERYRPSADVAVMSIGNFEGVFPRPRPESIVRSDLGLDPAKPIVSCLGLLRNYKGLEIACAAAKLLKDEVQLVIAGAPYKDYDVAMLRAHVATVRGASFIERRLSDQEFADLTASSAVSLLPYTRVTTSAVLLSSWTLGTGTIASDLPPFRELIQTSGDAGRVFTPGSAESLAETVRAYIAIPQAMRVAAAREQALKYSWSSCVRPVADWVLKQNFSEMPRVEEHVQP